MGTRDMHSVPPAIKASPAPIRSMPAATWTAWMDEPHQRLMVIPQVEIGRPASSATTLPRLSPCSPSGNAQPHTTSSISSPGTPVRSTSARTTCAPSASGRTSASGPLCAKVNGLRTYPTMKAAFRHPISIRCPAGSVRPTGSCSCQHEVRLANLLVRSDTSRHQRPSNRGSRRSKRAETPSPKSRVAAAATKATRSRSSCSASEPESARSARQTAKARVGPRASFPMRSSTKASNDASGKPR